MHHKLISFHHVGLSFPQKIYFEGFTTQIQYEPDRYYWSKRQWPGAMLVISHDEDFLKAINITPFYNLNQELENE